ncbi:MAG: class I SAM-dependent RNA methyltransferase [Verrucomicrobia bacterium]|nr:MAG: class I SAM-dependent RNA methyltransferase [Verrucomicrobiota bacterium]
MPLHSKKLSDHSEISLGDEVALRVVDVAFGGSGIGRINEMACFTKGVIDGEEVRARITRKKSRFLEATVVTIEQQSPHRRQPPCPYFLKCGGCAYQHIDYSHQLKIKEKQLHDAFERLGGIENPPVKAMIPSPEPFYYRNRITVHVRNGVLGFFKEKGNEVIEIQSCCIASKEVNQSLHKLRSQHPIDGDYLLGEKERYGGFRQVNNEVAKILLQEMKRYAGSGEVLIDAYCGSGFFSHALAPLFSKVIGIERSQGSIILARQEAASHEIFEEGSVEEMLPKKLQEASLLDTTLILDPPSEGLSELVIQSILNFPPAKIVYVSCNPGTLARDSKRLSLHYQLQESTPLDMFPQTAEIESINLLTRHVTLH